MITEVDEDHCRHTITGEVKVRIVGVGKLVEKYVMENTISALSLLDSVVARWCSAHVADLSHSERYLCPTSMGCECILGPTLASVDT